MVEQPERIGRYEVTSRIAQGGQGTLYKAFDRRLQRHVAVKLLRESDDEHLRERFEREARAVANLVHPNIVTVFEVAEHDGQPFMALEYINGHTLSSIIHSESPPPLVRRLELMEGLCDGLALAHRYGVVHRDIKPSNLMVDEAGRLKIVDFGIARGAGDPNLTRAGLLVGTFNYMSPEQVEGRLLDGRSDMFAVGVVFYEFLSGCQAFPGNVPTAVLQRILLDAPEPLEQLCPGLDSAIAAIVRRAMERDPDRRFADMNEMRLAIARAREALDDTPAIEDAPPIAALLDAETRPPHLWGRPTNLEEAQGDDAPASKEQPTSGEPERPLTAEEHEADAHRTAEDARRLFDDGDCGEALALLEDFRPAHPLVSRAWVELSAKSAQGSPEARHGDDPVDATSRPSRHVVGPEATDRRSRSSLARLAVAAAVLFALAGLAAGLWIPRRDAPAGAVAASAHTAANTDPSATVGTLSAPPIDVTPLPRPAAGSPRGADPKSGTPPAVATANQPPIPDRSIEAQDRTPSGTEAVPTSAIVPSVGVLSDAANGPAILAAPPAQAPAPALTSSGPPTAGDRSLQSEPERSARTPAPAAAPQNPVSITPPPQPLPQPARLLSDEEQVQRTLAAYRQALDGRDVAGVLRVFPNANPAQVAQMFDGVVELTMEIGVRSTRVDGDRAVVGANVTQWIRKARDQRRRTDQLMEFQLQRTGDGWVITAIRPR
jgi:serine/threonine-protein kinase